MTKLHSILTSVALGSVPLVAGVLVWVLWPLHGAILGMRTQGYALAVKAGVVLDHSDATLAAVNAPCTSFHGSATCGALAQLSQTEKNIGIVAAQGAEQVKQSGQLITGAATNMNEVGQHVSDVADALKGTAGAATGTLSQATTDLQTANGVIADAKPLVAHLDTVATGMATVEGSLNDFLAAKSLKNLMENLATGTATGDHMLFTADAVETKATHSYLNPPHGAAAIWPAIKPYILPGVQVAGAVAIDVTK